MKQKTQECHECGAVKAKRAMYAVDAYNTPWDKTPITIYTCKNTPRKMKKAYRWLESCEELLTDSSWADFRYFTCEHCDRFICEQNPRNGWHVQYRILNECEQVCLKCYEALLLDQGLEIQRESLESGQLPGMFLDSSEVSEAGFERDETYNDVRVAGTIKAQEIAKYCLDKMDSNIVLIEYESMAIGGLEGYVTVWSKPK